MPGTNATVVVGTITIDDNNGEFITPADGISIYQDVQIRNRYEKDKYIYVLPITSPNGFQGTSVAFVQLAAPTLLWIADWTIFRSQTKPDIPNPVSQDPNWILLDEHYEPGMVVVGPDGVTPYWRISGTYFYGHTNPSATTIRNINFSRPPFIKDDLDRTVPISTLQPSIIDFQGSQGKGFFVAGGGG